MTTKAKLIDTTKCIGCRSCQVSCKQWNGLEAVKTSAPAAGLGLQNPVTLSAKTFTVVTSSEIADPKAPGGMRYVFAKRQCMHCEEPACASACPVTAMAKTKEGAVVYDDAKCIGCRYCMWACPFGVPTAEWDSLAPKIRKCTQCYDRAGQPAPEERNGQKLSDEDRTRFAAAQAVPACVKQCPAGALQFGEREALLAEAKRRIAAHPDRYVDRVYGEKEAGGTGVLYLASVPFEQLGFPNVGFESYPQRSVVALGAVPPAVIGVGAVLGGAYALGKRRAEVARAEPHHVEFAPVPGKVWTPWNLVLAALVFLGGISFLARFALGLGGSTNLSDTWAWGLWIQFDFSWIAIAAGAFASAGLIYVFRREDLYSLGRAAVLMGFLSYTFVVVTLIADLGLPWHFWQLGVQAPKHSAMFEVDWCVGLYVTILAFEFLPVVLERLGWARGLALWRKYAPGYVVVAVSLFVFLMSRSLVYTGIAAVVFAALAWAFRPKPGERAVPILLAIAAVTLSTMHQSSLGSLFLLMPDKLDPAWWSPLMPIEFFLSSIAAGTALVVLVEMWVAKGFGRPLRIRQLAAMGQVTFWATLVYGAVRLGDLVVRGKLGAAMSGPHSGLFVAEVALGALVPLALLSSARLRERPGLLAVASFLAVAGVTFNRVNAVALAMELRGPLPQIAPHPYLPSVFEWGISVGLVAATILLFGIAVRFLPVLPKEDASH